jgi:hypothetical protein
MIPPERQDSWLDVRKYDITLKGTKSLEKFRSVFLILLFIPYLRSVGGLVAP